MKSIRILLVSCLALLFASCGGEKHFLTDSKYRTRVHKDFLERKELAAGRSEVLFGVMDSSLTTEQREALEFLYAYMPLCDLSEYNGEYFLRQVDGAFRARDYFSWGSSMPEEVFRHFVLVYRVNNEYMDDARDVFFDLLKDRVKDLSMYDAALEVNHWCHELVTYRATDARTSAPLALMKTSWGRCGEESTFTTTALRAVGIPARQCYTPRWAHTDNNHAWVEVWIDGKWQYLGACEPEPKLNVAWFDGPVKRAMMTHTTVYGEYNGPETKNVETPLYSVINTLTNYTNTRMAHVEILDTDGNHVAGAKVQFKIYNYAQLYPLVTMASDENGRAILETGMGDVMVWASKDGKYGYAKSSPGDDTVAVVLDKTPGADYTEDYSIAAPKEQPFEELPTELVAGNAVRLAYEDSIRNAYMATFPKEEYAAIIATETGLSHEVVWKTIFASQGNWQEIEKFLRKEKSHPELNAFLASLRDKDLRDTPAHYLSDHLNTQRGAAADIPKELYATTVLSPRIGYELIQPWRGYFNRFFDANPQIATVEDIIKYVNSSIIIRNEDNYYNCRQNPQGVHELKVADNRSRDIYFVALCRSFGCPSRLDPATARPQYWRNEWIDVLFDTEEIISEATPKGNLTLLSHPTNVIKPAYETHFTLARFEDGDFQVLKLDDAAIFGKFPATISLNEGYYRLFVGSRANNGSTAIATQYFSIAPDKPQTLTVKLPELEGLLFVKGVVDMNSIVYLMDNTKTTLKELGKGKGAILIFADPDKEPTKHILQDFPAEKEEIEAWGGAVVMLVPDDKMTKAFAPNRFANLPAQTVWAKDDGRLLLKAAAEAAQVQFTNNFPLALYLTNNGGTVYSSVGYSIGIPSDIVKIIKLEAQSKK
ncbi:transglutaminase domain-containing protein [Bacteroides sp. 214]|uniref:transglutaminase-like domain-containing protein n=1 Tax=Bacteroides sp. 214 TaxID=2302935 RepID=UPI0013CFA725|nr:transglutaminase domain-containing protein [Bacteroides sp. 214]NDW13493.1 transglutaminase domain-containing protein [Bacteroides sp. 214]